MFRRVRIPSSLPFVFSALKVASVLAMIGAVVGDYFGGSVEASGIVDPERGRALTVRDRVGRDPRREHHGHCFLRRRSLSASDTPCAGIPRVGAEGVVGQVGMASAVPRPKKEGT